MSTRWIQSQMVEYSKLEVGYDLTILILSNVLTELRSRFILCKLVFCKINLKLSLIYTRK